MLIFFFSWVLFLLIFLLNLCSICLCLEEVVKFVKIRLIVVRMFLVMLKIVFCVIVVSIILIIVRLLFVVRFGEMEFLFGKRFLFVKFFVWFMNWVNCFCSFWRILLCFLVILLNSLWLF